MANPNTSVTVLSRLGAAFPDELATNPLLGWLHVENADFLASLPALVRHRLLMVAEPGLLWWAARFGTEDDKRALLTNADVPVDLLQWLDRNDTEVIQLLVRDHIRFPGLINPSIVRRLLPSAGAGDFDELVFMGLVPTWMLPSAVNASDVDVRRLVAARPELTRSDIEVLLFDTDDRVRTIAAVKGKPGEVTSISDASLLVTAQGGQLEITRLKHEEGKKLSAGEFAANHGVAAGALFGS